MRIKTTFKATNTAIRRTITQQWTIKATNLLGAWLGHDSRWH